MENHNRFPEYSTQTLQLLTAQQAVADYARFIQYIKEEYNTPNSLVLTIGGSYPGWLSAMMRIRYPEVVDFAYAGSAPMKFYSQDVQQYAYYEVVTNSAEKASPGCAAAVRSMLATLQAADKPTIINKLELCSPLPDYIQQDPVSTMINEINMVVMYTFATLNMENYPPPNTSLKTACDAIKMYVGTANPWEALGGFLRGYSVSPLKRGTLQANCYNLTNQLPAGNNATITSGDWSGVGNGINGANWDFETSTLLVELIGTNGQTDMFLPRPFTLDWLTQHSKIRFNTVPHPRLLADLWGFGDLRKIGTSFIIFTNGLNDGWSAGGWMEPIPEKDIFVLNMPNGAHHSDLLHDVITNDTPDVMAVKSTISQIIGNWLATKSQK